MISLLFLFLFERFVQRIMKMVELKDSKPSVPSFPAANGFVLWGLFLPCYRGRPANGEGWLFGPPTIDSPPATHMRNPDSGLAGLCTPELTRNLEFSVP